ncbi:MAG: alpha/beta fold hydrolase [Bryobacteraceae bacterium]
MSAAVFPLGSREVTKAKTVKIGTSTTQYRVEGRGDPLVLIHGLGGSTGWWVRNIGALSQHFTVYTVDLPGFGGMRRHPEPFSVRGAVAWLETLFDALGLDTVSLVGHSMGALVAAIFAGERPERVHRLVLAAPAIELPSSRIAAYLLPLARETLRVERSFWKTLVWDSLRAGLSTAVHASRDLLRSNVDYELSQISTPCLLIWGELDPLVPPNLAGGLQKKIQGSELCVLKGAGHVLMYDHAEPFNTVVLEFLAGRFEGRHA